MAISFLAISCQSSHFIAACCLSVVAIVSHRSSSTLRFGIHNRACSVHMAPLYLTAQNHTEFVVENEKIARLKCHVPLEFGA